MANINSKCKYCDESIFKDENKSIFWRHTKNNYILCEKNNGKKATPLNENEIKMKNTKEFGNLREAIKEQDLDINYYIDTAKSIIRELKKEYSHRSYIYEKIKILQQLEKY